MTKFWSSSPKNILIKFRIKNKKVKTKTDIIQKVEQLNSDVVAEC